MGQQQETKTDSENQDTLQGLLSHQIGNEQGPGTLWSRAPLGTAWGREVTVALLVGS